MAQRRPASYLDFTGEQIRLIILGFRFGQLIDVSEKYAQGCNDDERDLIGCLIDNIQDSLEPCSPYFSSVSDLHQRIGEMAAVWVDIQLVEQNGLAAPAVAVARAAFRMLHRIQSSFARETPQRRSIEIGFQLGCSWGWDDLSDGGDTIEWQYRSATQLETSYRQLGRHGDGSAFSAERLVELRQQADDDDVRLRRYPPSRWGWGFLEELLETWSERAIPDSAQPTELKPAHALALLAHQFACSEDPSITTAKEAHVYLSRISKEEFEQLSGRYRALQDYQLPQLETFRSYLSRARKAAVHREERARPQKGRSVIDVTGRSTMDE